MYVRKSRRNSQKGLDPSTYYNTRDNSNTPVLQVEGDTSKLPPTPDSPVAPSTTPVSPRITPVQPQPGRLLPLFGVTGKVYVILTRPVTTEAIVVVEVTNDELLYSDTIDKVYLGKFSRTAPAVPIDLHHPNIEHVLEGLNIALWSTGYSSTEILGHIAYQLSAYLSLLQTTDPIITIFLDVASTTVTEPNNATKTAEVDLWIYDGELGSIASAMVSHWVVTQASPETLTHVTWGVFPKRNVGAESMRTGKDSFEIDTHLMLVAEFAVLHDVGSTHVTVLIELRYKASLKVIPVDAIHCPPLTDREGTELYKDSLKWLRLEGYTNRTVKPKVRRAYTNIGGKLTYLYTTAVEATTEVLVNYDGGAYGLVVNVTEDDPDTGQPVTKRHTVSTSALVPNAAFTNNVNGKGLNPTNQTALQPVLQQPVDIDEEYAASIPTATTFKAYGFEPLFSSEGGAYNDITIKGAAIL